MDRQDNTGTLALVAVIATWIISSAITSNIVMTEADEMTCPKQRTNADGSCRSRERKILAYWRISVNKSAGTCAMLFSVPGGDSGILHGGTSLIYVDPDNWRCESLSTGPGRIASMENGRLVIGETIGNE